MARSKFRPPPELVDFVAGYPGPPETQYHGVHATDTVSTMRPIPRVKLLVLLCLLVAGCAQTPMGVAKSAPTPIVPCTLIASADVASAFQRQFQAGTRNSAPGEVDNECMYLGAGLVGIEVESGATAPNFYATAEQKFTLEPAQGGSNAAPVSGVGDRALLAADGTAILAIKGKIAVFITALLPAAAAADLRSGDVLLAKLVFSRTG